MRHFERQLRCHRCRQRTPGLSGRANRGVDPRRTSGRRVACRIFRRLPGSAARRGSSSRHAGELQLPEGTSFKFGAASVRWPHDFGWDILRPSSRTTGPTRFCSRTHYEVGSLAGVQSAPWRRTYDLTSLNADLVPDGVTNTNTEAALARRTVRSLRLRPPRQFRVVRQSTRSRRGRCGLRQQRRRLSLRHRSGWKTATEDLSRSGDRGSLHAAFARLGRSNLLPELRSTVRRREPCARSGIVSPRSASAGLFPSADTTSRAGPLGATPRKGSWTCDRFGYACALSVSGRPPAAGRAKLSR